MSDKIKIERKGAVTTLRLNDPDAMNALTPDMAEALHDALRAEAKTARAIVLAGSERAFCAGANLKSSMPRDMTDFDAGQSKSLECGQTIFYKTGDYAVLRRVDHR